MDSPFAPSKKKYFTDALAHFCIFVNLQFPASAVFTTKRSGHSKFANILLLCLKRWVEKLETKHILFKLIQISTNNNSTGLVFLEGIALDRTFCTPLAFLPGLAKKFASISCKVNGNDTE